MHELIVTIWENNARKLLITREGIFLFMREPTGVFIDVIGSITLPPRQAEASNSARQAYASTLERAAF
jgi:hypothetical protein